MKKKRGSVNMSANSNLHKAKSVKNDEFYTRLEDIENELKHYRGHFKDKVVYCNCDDPMVSNFFKYFLLNFKHLGLKRLITSCYRNIDAGKQTDGLSDKAVWLEYDGQGDDGVLLSLDNVVIHEFEGDGDFRSDESIALLKQADIVVTNPPFSLFREYIAQLIEYQKLFVVLGSMNAVTYKEIFPLLKDNKMWLGHKNGSMQFYLPEHAELKKCGYIDDQGRKVQKFGNIAWFTNMDIAKRHEDIILYKAYEPEEYPKYDNYDAIEVSRVVNIPVGYDGVMGVPITFLDKFNPEQFEILGSQRWAKSQEMLDVYCGTSEPPENDKKTLINGKETYDRIFIKHKNAGCVN